MDKRRKGILPRSYRSLYGMSQFLANFKATLVIIVFAFILIVGDKEMMRTYVEILSGVSSSLFRVASSDPHSFEVPVLATGIL